MSCRFREGATSYYHPASVCRLCVLTEFVREIRVPYGELALPFQQPYHAVQILHTVQIGYQPTACPIDGTVLYGIDLDLDSALQSPTHDD